MARSSLISAALLGVSSWLLLSLVSRPAFLSSGSMRAGGRTAMRGFKEDFASWKSTLSSDEKDLLLKQAQNEYDKKFRKSEDFSKTIADDKIESFSKILKKFFDSEMEEYEKEAGAKTPDYTALKRKAANKVYDFSLKPRIVEHDRDADRRWQFVSVMDEDYATRGEKFPMSSPIKEEHTIPNDNEEYHEAIKKVFKLAEELSKVVTDKDDKAELEALVKEGPPPIGTPWKVEMRQVPVLQAEVLWDQLEASDKSPEEKEKLWAENLAKIFDRYYESVNDIEKNVDNMKAFFRSQKDMPGKTKADILKGIWAELPKHTDKPVPPLDEEMLSELAQEPAVNKDNMEFKHNWGTADVLYKSEAIDSFGVKYLLGVFETKEEAAKAFDDWNKEYEKAGEEVKDELVQWGKTETAFLEEYTRSNTEIVMKGLEEARR
eukprot:TRINITY_DN2810_c0_g1_i3.p1 TRINITY_DN2810_c0_g1~~TRINITY_DN2810_c0_g1_i3.p1  ORF type:complete len:445 (-),score=161.20 TRINITY_DN2810_c0_g1_i3:72-1370(-)